MTERHSEKPFPGFARALTLWCTIAAILMLSIWLDASVRASPLRMGVTAAFHDYYRAGNWLPLRVDIENQGMPLKGLLAIHMGSRQFVQPVSLATPTKKRFELYVLPLRGHEALSLSLTASEKIITTARIRLKRLSENASVVVAVTPHRSSYDFLPHLARSPSKRTVVYTAAAELPESWKGYDILEAVILDASEIDTLSPLQRQALIRWLQLGGRLLLVGKTPRSRTSALYRQLLALTDAAMTSNRAATPVGLGSLLYTAVPPDASGIRTDAGLRIPWQAWLEAQPPWPLAVLDRQILRRLTTAPRGQKHLVHYLGGFLCLYVASMTGLFGRSLPARASPWRRYASGSGVILTFALLSLCVGLVVHGGAVINRESTLIHAFPRSSDLYATTAAILLTPAKQRYGFQGSSGAFMQSAATMPLRYAFTAHQTPATVHFSAPMWANRHLLLERFIEPSWFASGSGDASTLLLHRSPFELRHCHRLGGRGMFRLPDVRRGQTLSLTPSTSEAVEPFQLRELPSLLARVLSAYQGALSLTDNLDHVVCSLSDTVPGLTSPTHNMRHEGTTVLIVHLERQTGSESR